MTEKINIRLNERYKKEKVLGIPIPFTGYRVTNGSLSYSSGGGYGTEAPITPTECLDRLLGEIPDIKGSNSLDVEVNLIDRSDQVNKIYAALTNFSLRRVLDVNLKYNFSNGDPSQTRKIRNTLDVTSNYTN